MMNTPGQTRIVQHSSVAHAYGSAKFDKEHMEHTKHTVPWHGLSGPSSPLDGNAKMELASIWSVETFECSLYARLAKEN
jgi:hypothetical protein